MTKIIAELCQNHNGDLDILKKMVWSAADCGVTHAKIQTMFSEDLTFRSRFEQGVVSDDGIITSIKRPYSLELERLKGLDLDMKYHSVFIDEWLAAGIIPLTTIFSWSRLGSIIDAGFKEIKIASYDCASFPLINDLKNVNKTLTSGYIDDAIEEIIDDLDVRKKFIKNVAELTKAYAVCKLST